MAVRTIDVFSDIVCPWCFIGTRRLERVLAELGLTDTTEVRYRTFLLDPDAPPEGKDIHAELRRKYGRDPAPMFARVEAEARTSGIPLELARQPTMYPTVLAHTLLRHAAPAHQAGLARALFEAYFLEARNIADPTVLVELATAHGMTADEATRLLADPAELAATRRDAEAPRKLGIQGAPFFVVDGKLGISGAQPEAVFKRALTEAQAES